MYKYMSYELRDRQVEGEQAMYRSPAVPDEVLAYEEPVDLDQLLGDLTLARLNKVFREVMRRQTDKIDPVRSKFGKIEKEEVTLPDKLTYVTEYARKHGRFGFRELLERQHSRIQVVVTFLAVLQLIKEGAIFIEQEQPFDEIMISSNVLSGLA